MCRNRTKMLMNRKTNIKGKRDNYGRRIKSSQQQEQMKIFKLSSKCQKW